MTTRTLLILPALGLMIACGDKDGGGSGSDAGGGGGSDSGEGDGEDPVDADEDGYDADADCDDNDPAINPGATEVCDDDDVDEDCSGAADDDDPGVDTSTATTWYVDADSDTFGDLTDSGTLVCDDPSDGGATYSLDNTDCNDADATVHPDAVEVCDDDDTDEDCSGEADDADAGVDLSTATTWYPDADQDEFGDEDDAGIALCDDPSTEDDWFTTENSDCDDAAAGVHPDAVEVCDAADVDEDCSGDADDLDAGVDTSTQTLFYPDVDQDAFGDEDDAGTLFCDDPSTVSDWFNIDNTDCDDTEASINPGETEVCDPANVDEDCSGDADDDDSGVDPSTKSTYYPDDDQDGFGDEDTAGSFYCDDPSTLSNWFTTDNTDCDDDDAGQYPRAAELCNGEDDDCDGSSDDSGLATFWDTAGTATDYTSVLTGSVALSSPGELAICEGTWTANITASASIDIYGQTGDASEVVLDGGGADPVLVMYTDSVDVTLSDLTVTNGVGSATLFGGDATYESGAGITCYSAAGDATLVLDNVSVTENEAAYVGGGMFAYDCEVTLTDSEIIENQSLIAGGVMWGGGDLQVTDSAINSNDATDDVGGLYLFDWSGNGATFTMTDSSISDNTAVDAVGGLYVEGATGTVTGTSSGAASITGNSDAGDAGVWVGEDGELTFSDVDFGTTAGGDDNDPYDIYVETSDRAYWYDDGESMTCTDEICGTESDVTIGSSSSDNDYAEGARGNIILAEDNGTIHDISAYLNVTTGSGCDLDLYVLSAGSKSDATWDVEYVESTVITDTAAGWVTTDAIDLPVEVGRYYAFAYYWDCESAETLEYFYESSSGSTSDAGFGSSDGRWVSTSYSGPHSTTADEWVSTASIRAYIGHAWSH